MANKVVSNTGPIMHLTEIDLVKALNIFSTIFIPNEVANELKRSNIFISSKIKTLKLKSESKDFVKILTYQHNLDLGEAEAIALAFQEKTKYFITDDLEAREVAKFYNIETHGTIGIILRALRQNIIDKKMAIEKVKELKTISSLFITQDIIEEIINSIKKFSDRN